VAGLKGVLSVPPQYSSYLDSAENARIQRVVRSVFDGLPPKPSSVSRTLAPACP
jgi:hypothetical protein